MYSTQLGLNQEFFFEILKIVWDIEKIPRNIENLKKKIRITIAFIIKKDSDVKIGCYRLSRGDLFLS